MAENAECARCGIAATDLPYEDLGMTLAEASEFLFDHDNEGLGVRGRREDRAVDLQRPRVPRRSDLVDPVAARALEW